MFGWSSAETPPDPKAAEIPAPPALDELREEYKEKMAQLREVLKEDLEANEMYKEELWLLRYLLNPKYTIDQVADRVRKMIKMREDDGVNEIMKEIEKGGSEKFDLTKFPHFEVVNRAFPESLWQTTDTHGQPVAVQLLGRSEPKDLLKAVSKEEFYKYTLYKAEFMRIVIDKLSHKHNKLIQWIQIVDLNGLGMKHGNTTAMDLVKSASNRVDQMYKECLGKILVVNAPSVFHMIWAMVKLWVSERTAQKVTLLGAAYKQEIPTNVPKEKLPHFLGGDLKTGKIAFREYDESW